MLLTLNTLKLNYLSNKTVIFLNFCLLVSLYLYPNLNYADVWIINKDGTTVFHQKTDYLRRNGYLKHKTPPISILRKKYDAMIKLESVKYSIDPLLVHAVIQNESRYQAKIISHKGAVGLMQLIPSTAKRFNVKDSTDPEENIRGGVQYLAYLFTLFEQPKHVLAAYNAGENRVAPCIDKSILQDCERLPAKIPNIKETKNYVTSVLADYHQLLDTHKRI